MIRKILSKIKKIIYFYILNKFILFNLNSFKYKKEFLPIFIVGAPRSGTTLVYQSLIKYFDLGYLTNANCFLFGNFKLSERLFKRKKQIDFNSSFGITKGFYGPSECGNFWYLFFKRNYNNEKDMFLNNKKRNLLKKSIYSFSYYLNKNIVFKNVFNSLRIKELSKIFPNAIFIVVKRDLFDNSHSILDARYKLYKDYNKWFALKPFSIKIYNEPIKDVFNQIIYTNKYIDDCLNKINNDFIYIDYNDFCNNPKKNLKNIEKLFLKNNIRFNKIQETKFPNKFNINKKIKINKKLYKELKNYAKSKK